MNGNFPYMRVWMVLAISALFIGWVWAKSSSGTLTDGENIYRRGILPSGASVAGTREEGGSAAGAVVACVNCHRRSGLGTVEGRTMIPPITAKYLFRSSDQIPAELHSSDMDHAVNLAPRTGHPTRGAYTDATLARAIRDGISPDGHPFDYLMPRYPLDDSAMASLIAYLKELSSGRVPGVTADTLHFATIVTPDADPARRKGMLDVLEHFFATKNEFYQAKTPPMQGFRRVEFRVARRWQLHVWELAGAPETWEEQLRNHLRAEPVFAVISGLGGRDWEPVHRFCEQESIPCLFPNVDLPVVAEGDFYNVYFSKGVLLEAQLIAREIRDTAAKAHIRRVIQVYRKDDIGVQAATALRDAMAPQSLAILDRALESRAEDDELAAALKKAGAEDALILWLRPDDLRNLPAEPAKSPAVFMSGLMGGLENSPLQGAWRSATSMAYPFELPSKRAVLLNYPLGWFRIERIPVVAERTQVDTYIVCSIVSEILNDMQDNFVRDYLLENVEVMLSPRIVNGYYTRLGLAPGQRFASKGGYIVRFADPEGKQLIAEGDWIVP